MTRNLFKAGLVFLFAFAACQKETDTPPEPSNEKLPRYLLKEIQWDNGMKTVCHYNSDSTLSHTTSALGSAAGQISFLWNAGKLSEMYDDRSLYTNQFVYDEKSRLTAINHIRRNGPPTVSFSLEYGYDNTNRLQELRYYNVNEAGKQLKATTTYHYGTSGDLAKLVTQSGNNEITHTIDAYSDTVSFAYTHYLSASLTEYYPLYNYPVLSRLVRLPAKITKRVKIGLSEAKVDKIEEMTYTITDYRIDKVITRLTFPDHPVYNQTQESVYRYY